MSPKTEIVHAGVIRQIVHEADIRAFGSGDRADAPVIRWMNVADFEARALPCETARTHRRYSAFMLEFGERIHLVHKLRKLGSGKKSRTTEVKSL